MNLFKENITVARDAMKLYMIYFNYGNKIKTKKRSGKM